MSWPKTPEHGHAKLGDELRNMIKGMSVSVDVSTGDHDAGHRHFGTVTEVMDDLYDKHGVTLLVQDAEPNFVLATPTQAQAGAVPTREFLERTLAAMEGVIDVADRKTDEFDALRSCVIDLTLMLFSDANRHAKEVDHEL